MVTTLAGGILLYSRTRRLAHFLTLLSLVYMCAGSNLTKVGFTRLHHPKVLVSYTHVLDVRKGLVPEPLSEIKKWKSEVEGWLHRKAHGTLTEEDYLPFLRKGAVGHAST